MTSLKNYPFETKEMDSLLVLLETLFPETSEGFSEVCEIVSTYSYLPYKTWSWIKQHLVYDDEDDRPKGPGAVLIAEKLVQMIPEKPKNNHG